ncbi:MAG: COG1361 S-layer family protein [Candidatus Aenigmarchaeota archaeon]|nr:COG1361 S-layer family protein [Candidatus Aenigmarchaeota archaeon]
MKNKLLSSLVVLSMILVLSQVASAASDDLGVILTKQSPYPVEPDQVVDIEVSLQNDGYGDAENIIFKIVPENPFSLLPGEDETATFTRISAQDHVTITYKLYVDKNAISNNYDLKFEYYGRGDTVKKTQDVTVQVEGKPKLILDEIITTPEQMQPGDSVTFTVRIKNVGTGSASFMEADLTSDSEYILPELSGGSDFVGEIKPGQTGEAIFVMSIDNSAEYKTYSGDISLSYKDDSGDAQTSSFDIGMPIRGIPIMKILSAKIDNSAYKVDVENIGTSNAKALKIALVQNGEMIDSAIASELRPSKSKTVRFSGFSYGQAIVNISYLNENNEFFSEENIVTISKSAGSEESGGDGSTPLVPILIVVVVLESYYVWRMRKKLKKQ